MISMMTAVQFALKVCEIHERKELHAYCKECKKKICSVCIKEEHASHGWETIADMSRDKKCILPTECKTITTKQLPRIQKEIEGFDQKIKNADDDFDRNKSTLKKSRECYIGEVNKFFDIREEECQKKCKEAKEIYKENRDSLKEKYNRLELLTTSFTKELHELPDHDVIDMDDEMKEGLDEALSLSSDKHMCATVFEPFKMDRKLLNDKVGSIHHVSLEKIREIDKCSSSISSVQCIAEDKVIARLKGDEYAKIFSNSGKELKVMKTSCTEIVVMNCGDIVFTSFNGGNVLVTDKDENKKRLFYTTPMHPSNISRTKKDEILLTCTENGDRYKLSSASRRVIQRVDLWGNVIHVYEFGEDGRTRLFTLPSKTVENKNTDICVVNYLDKERAELVVLKSDGRVKFIYKGEGASRGRNKFYPTDAACDPSSHILFTEYYGRSVEMLSSGGMYLCRLCQYELVHPYTISLHRNIFVCGFSEGKVKMFKYNK